MFLNASLTPALTCALSQALNFKCLLNPIPGLELLPALVGQPLRDGLVQPRQLPLDLGEVGEVLPAGEVRLPVAAGQPHEELHAGVARRVLEGDSMGFIIAFTM